MWHFTLLPLENARMWFCSTSSSFYELLTSSQPLLDLRLVRILSGVGGMLSKTLICEKCCIANAVVLEVAGVGRVKRRELRTYTVELINTVGLIFLTTCNFYLSMLKCGYCGNVVDAYNRYYSRLSLSVLLLR